MRAELQGRCISKTIADIDAQRRVRSYLPKKHEQHSNPPSLFLQIFSFFRPLRNHAIKR